MALAGPAHPAPPPGENPYAAEVRAALADARKVGPVLSAQTRYLTTFNYPEATRERLWRKVIDLYANSTSRAGQIYKVRRVGTLLAINVFDYGPVWPVVWEKFAAVDPHFHVQVDLQVGKVGRMYHPAGGGYRAGWYDTDVTQAIRTPALAPWLPAAEAAELVALTQSATPILRADFFFSQAAIQAGRKDTGYYSFLGIKDLADFDKLIGFDRKASQDREYEVAGIVARSGVSNFPRQVFIERSLTGERAETRDVLDDNKDERNALRQLDKDYKFQALEVYGFNTVGLFVYALADNKGVLQETAPDKIGSDKTATGNDGRIHPFLSCQRCHLEGYRPVNDRSRKRYTGGLVLTSPDPVQHRRLNQIYLGDLATVIDDANAKYARQLKRVTGWTTEEAAKAVGEAWAVYVEKDYLPADLAHELGVKEEDYLRVLREYFRANQLGDPVLADHIADPPLAIRSDDVEQIYPIVASIILGGKK